MTRFKICGLRDVSNALVAAESGADFLGFNFVEGVRRQLQPAEGSQIIYDFRMAFDGDSMPGIVGLFANQDADFINDIIHRCGLDYVQLCGDEPPCYPGDDLGCPGDEAGQGQGRPSEVGSGRIGVSPGG